jgi:hypothetical protein
MSFWIIASVAISLNWKKKNATRTFIIYTCDLYNVKKYRNKIDKLLF